MWLGSREESVMDQYPGWFMAAGGLPMGKKKSLPGKTKFEGNMQYGSMVVCSGVV